MAKQFSTIAKYLYTLLFLFFAAVQYNDPDPIIWIPTYLIPIYLVWKKGKRDLALYFVIGFVFFLWAATQFPPEWEGVKLNAMGMKTLNIELGRESLGLAIAGFSVWLISLLK
jgi:hypothetical protein